MKTYFSNLELHLDHKGYSPRNKESIIFFHGDSPKNLLESLTIREYPKGSLIFSDIKDEKKSQIKNPVQDTMLCWILSSYIHVTHTLKKTHTSESQT